MTARKCKCGRRIYPLRIKTFGSDDLHEYWPDTCAKCAAELVRAEDAQKAAQEAGKRHQKAIASVPLPDTSPTDKRAVTGLLRDVDKARAKGKAVYLWGKTGTWKTRALCVVGMRLVAEGRGMEWMSCPRMLRNYSLSLMSDSREAEKSIRLYENADIFLIDDFGKGSVTERGRELLYSIIDYRFCMGRETWYTSNNPPEFCTTWMKGDVNSTAEAVIRRIREACVVIQTGKGK